MGIIQQFRAVAGKLFSRRGQQKPSDAYVSEGEYSGGVASPVTKTSSPVKYAGAQSDEYVFYPDGREKISDILCKLSVNSLLSLPSTNLSSRCWSESLSRTLSGNKIIKEGSKDKSPSRPRLDKQDFTVMMEEMQARMEKLQYDMNNMKQQNEVSAKCANGLESFEFSAGLSRVQRLPNLIEKSFNHCVTLIEKSRYRKVQDVRASDSAARQPASDSHFNPAAKRAKAPLLIQRRGLAGGGDHHGPPKVNFWQDPMSPSKWKEEHKPTAGYFMFYGLELFCHLVATDLNSGDHFLPQYPKYSGFKP
ncbi:hypothetical protein HAX54_039267 [Datura stramonium]|uniref:Uncharacterized protein n=1 Tax=Datura stramonium TaxID=4076 RepID=A0ABS8SIR7_DATST|nr:hypothetical protein [Datura stramonium]